MLAGRLRNVRRREDHHRRLLCIANDISKFNQNFVEGNLAREKQYYDLQRERCATIYRNTFAKKKVLQTCMKMSREDTITSINGNLYGHYSGRSVKMYDRQVNYVLANSNVKQKKLKRIKNLFEKGKKTGLILEPEAMEEKVKHYFQEKWGVQYKNEAHAKPGSPVAASTPNPKREEKLPSLFSFHKIPIRPLREDPKNSSGDEDKKMWRNDDTATEENSARCRRQRLKKLAERASCTKPKCGGYMGERTNPKIFVLPPIQTMAPYLVQGTNG